MFLFLCEVLNYRDLGVAIPVDTPASDKSDADLDRRKRRVD